MNDMSITEIYRSYEMYGRIRYFLCDRCWNSEGLRGFNKNKISAPELVTFDCGLMEMYEIENEQVSAKRTDSRQVLAVIIRPGIEPNNRLSGGPFVFCGYDLIEETTTISAITNCGAGFEEAICYETLNGYGLISTYREAVNTQLSLYEKYPDENHACCEIVEIWRL